MRWEICKDNPSQMVLGETTDSELSLVRDLLTFRDRQIEFDLLKLKRNHWLQSSDPVEWEKRKQELKEKLYRCILTEQDGCLVTYSGLFNDIANVVPKAELLNYVHYPEPDSIAWSKVPEHEDRYYQNEAKEKLLAVRHGAVQLPTGSGKTSIVRKLLHDIGAQSVVMVPTTSIARQMYNDLARYLGKRLVGLYGDGKKELGKKFTVGIAASLTRIEKGSDAWRHFTKSSVFVADECFPYDAGVVTHTGVRAIGAVVSDVQRGKVVHVRSLDNDGRYVYKRVLRGRAVQMRKLVCVVTDKTSITCTGNHPLLTTSGYVAAEDLHANDVLIGTAAVGNGLGCLNDDQQQLVLGSFLGDGSIETRKSGIRLQEIHGEAQKGYCKWKAELMGARVRYVPRNGYAQTEGFRFTTKVFTSPFTFSCPKKKVTQEVVSGIDDRAVAVWFMDDGSTQRVKYRTRDGVSEYVYGVFHTESFEEETVDMLVCRLNKMGFSCRKQKQPKGWTIRTRVVGYRVMEQRLAQYIHPDLSYKFPRVVTGGYKWSGEFKEYAHHKVMSVTEYAPSLHERRRASQRFLYDIEVEETNNFLVQRTRRRNSSGIVAHNCHMCPASTLDKVCTGVLRGAPYRFFFSATQTRTDGAELLLKGITGPVVYEKTFKELVDEGYLAKPMWKMVRVTSTIPYYSDDAMRMTQQHLYYQPGVLQKAALIANSMAQDGRRVLILVDELPQFTSLLPLLRTEVRFAHGGVSGKDKAKLPQQYWKSDPSALVEAFDQGDFRVLVGTSCISMGTDLRSPEVVIYLQGGTSAIQIPQAVGRGTRRGFLYPDGHRKESFMFVDFAPVITNQRFTDTGDGKSTPYSLPFRHALTRAQMYKNLYPGVMSWI